MIAYVRIWTPQNSAASQAAGENLHYNLWVHAGLGPEYQRLGHPNQGHRYQDLVACLHHLARTAGSTEGRLAHRLEDRAHPLIL